MFDGTLGDYPHRKFHIELEPGTRPRHARPYPIPVIHLEAFKKELMHLCEIEVLQSQGASECASPTFIIPQKDGRVHWVSDLRELNKVVKRRQYLLPIIQDMLKRRPGYHALISNESISPPSTSSTDITAPNWNAVSMIATNHSLHCLNI